MPKRKRIESNDFDEISKKLRKLEREMKKSRRCRKRVIESSSSSSSRDPSPSPENQQDGENDVHTSGDAQANTQGEAPTSNETADDNIPDAALDSIVLEILGEDPGTTVQYGKEIHKELASRFEYLATTGLSKETKKELNSKYLLPSNCIRTGAPILNAEIKAALPETLVKRDQAIEARQKQLATAISCLTAAITDQLNCEVKNHDHLKKLMDTGRLLCDLQHAESVTRRNFAVYSLKKDMKEHLSNTKIDKYLFGENLPDALKTAKAVCKSGVDLKIDQKIPKKTPQQQQQPQRNPLQMKNLNWKTPAPAHKQAGPQRSREPTTHRSHPASSSKQWRNQSKPTRRH